MKLVNGRPPKPIPQKAKVPLFVRLEKPFADLLKTAKHRKGLEQGPYLQALMTIADRQIPSRPKLIIRVSARRQP